jgi:hypothetical protein
MRMIGDDVHPLPTRKSNPDSALSIAYLAEW